MARKGIVIGGIAAVVLVIGFAAAGGDESSDSDTSKPPAAAAEADKAGEEKKDKPAEKKLSQAEEFKAFVEKNGSAEEKSAVAHVTKVQGADDQNDILDAADVYTDFTGGLMGEGQGQAKLIASAFADWKDSKNGLVTIYDKDGDLISNGNF